MAQSWETSFFAITRHPWASLRSFPPSINFGRMFTHGKPRPQQSHLPDIRLGGPTNRVLHLGYISIILLDGSKSMAKKMFEIKYKKNTTV